LRRDKPLIVSLGVTPASFAMRHLGLSRAVRKRYVTAFTWWSSNFPLQ
jgi:hypothetical protein